MGLPVEKPPRSTRADLDAVPSTKVAELINGELYVLPRPAPPHAMSTSRLGMKLGGPFDLGEGGPGGWRIFDEPELEFGPEGEEDVLVPDLAGWRIERLPRLPKTAQFKLAPDWICEVLSGRTETVDRAEKMAIYAREGVRYAWLLHPIRQTLEVFALNDVRKWTVLDVFRGPKRVRAEPFDAVELDLSVLWPNEEEAPDEIDEDRDITPVPSSRPKRSRSRAQRQDRKR